MSTLCKNCPFKGVKRTEGSCTELFAKKFHNSCVTYDISKHQFLKELNEFEKQMKTEVREMTEEEQKEFNDAVQHINEEMPKTPKRVRKTTDKKATTKKAATSEVEKEITEENG